MPAAVYDISRAALVQAQKIFPKIKTFTDYDRMLASAQLDALLIGTPAPLHAEFAVKTLRKNIHVLSEIPVVAGLQEMRALWEAHKKSRGLYMAAANPNFLGWLEAAVD